MSNPVATTSGERVTLHRAWATLYRHMTRRRRLQLAATLALMLMGAIAELVTIGAVLPLLALAADPAYFSQSPTAQAVLASVGLGPRDNLIIPAAALLTVAAILAAATRSALTWTSYRFVFGLGYDISVRVFGRMLRQPYEHYVRQNSSVALAAVEKIFNVVVGVLSPSLQAFTSAVIALSIGTFLFVVDPVTAAIAFTAMGLMYVVISAASKRALLANSRRTAFVRTQRLKVLQESWGGMRDIILDNSHDLFEKRIATHEHEMNRLLAHANFIIDVPRYSIESFGIVTVAMLAVYFSTQPGGVLAALPVLGALAIGAQRLLPLAQIVYRGWASYSIHVHSLTDVLTLMEAPVSREQGPGAAPKTLPEKSEITLEDVWFSYTPDEDVLKSINLSIRSGERIAFIGKTGSGKSTLVDVLMGLLRPSKGRLLIGDVELVDGNVAEWQGRIAHVPQAIFLSDDSIAANIAFGSSREDIDMERVLRAAERADVRSFVEQLPEGFATKVGERGIRLSGGQRQRIGIARALYKNATVLVLDEATSALDAATEASIMESIAGLDRELTIILIAHRLSTVAGCDTVYRLEAGRIAQSGSYEDVVLAAEAAPAHS
jgi:ABC-type multidrug transport system fused ATPase/permease subunit